MSGPRRKGEPLEFRPKGWEEIDRLLHRHSRRRVVAVWLVKVALGLLMLAVAAALGMVLGLILAALWELVKGIL